MDGQTISDLVYGLEIGRELKLPVSSCFRAEQMSQLLASAEVVRPFCQLRWVAVHAYNDKKCVGILGPEYDSIFNYLYQHQLV